jgi:hypothetical protein
MGIRFVTFDAALFTLIKPRAPIYVQYSRVFEPHFGLLEPDAIKTSSKTGTSTMGTNREMYFSQLMYDKMNSSERSTA